MQPLRLGTLALIVLAVATCAKELPTAPSDLTEGIVIYEDANFRGSSAHVTTDIANLHDFTGPCEENYDATTYSSTWSWGDCISSIRVAPGWRATLYGDDHYKGSQLEITQDVADLKKVAGKCGEGLNDCISSIRVTR